MVPNLTLLQTFYQVAQNGSYSAAARSLKLTYQSVANHVRKLEYFIGTPLVETTKGGKQILLTPKGRELYNLIYPELDIMLKRLDILTRKNRPVMRIGLPQAMFFYLFMDIVKELQVRHPGIEIQAMERDTMLRELILEGSLDVCISEAFFGDPAVPQHILGRYNVCLVAPTAWEEVGGDWKSVGGDEMLARLKNRPFVTFEPGQTLRNLAFDYLGQKGIKPQVSISTSGSSSVKKCVKEGLGFGIIPEYCIQPHDDDLCFLPLENIPRVKVYFGHAEYLKDSIYVKALYELWRDQMSVEVE